MPPVQCALKLMKKGKTVRAKDVMSFIITGSNNGSTEAAANNAFPLDDVLKKDSELKPDVDYYLHKQILPPVERLCAPIELTNVTRLAECLGLDTSKYRVSTSAANRDPINDTVQPLESQVPDHVRFAACSPLRFRCLNVDCKSTFEYVSLNDSPNAITHAGVTCPSCKRVMKNLTVVAQIEHQIRALIARYYEGWLICDDPSCGLRTRSMSVYGHRCLGPRVCSCNGHG